MQPLSAVSADGSLGLMPADGNCSGSASARNSVGQFSQVGLECPSARTFADSSSGSGETDWPPLMCLSEALLASLSAKWHRTPAGAVALPTKGTFTQHLSTPFVRFDHVTCSWNKSQQSFPTMEVGHSENTSVDWSKSGMTLSGIAYQLPQLVRVIAVNESGLWPTPQASDAFRAKFTIAQLKKAVSRNRLNGTGGGDASLSLAHQLAEQCEVYPSAMLGEYLMGYPENWTASGHSATPSCPKSHTSSAKPSTKSKAK